MNRHRKPPCAPQIGVAFVANALPCVLLLLLAACGGSPQGAAAPANTSATAARALPALPDDPLLLVPSGARVLGRADLEQLKASPHYAAARRWLTRYACIDPTASPWLVERTTRVVVAGIVLAGTGKPELIAVTRGDYLAEDATAAAKQLFATRGAPVPSEQARGRFTVWQGPELTAARLSDHLLAAGHTPEVLALLDVADGTRPSFVGHDVLMGELDSQRWLDDHTLALIAQLTKHDAQRLGSELESVGADQVTDGLAQGSVALALVLKRDAAIEAQALYANANHASQAAEQVRSKLGQAGFVLRLLGWPPALENVAVKTQGPVLKLSLRLSNGDVLQLLDKVEPMLSEGAPKCTPKAASGG